MCMVVYIASRRPIPLLDWRSDTPAFNVSELLDHEQGVRARFSLPNVRCAGSHTHCGCGFNEGRDYYSLEDDSSLRVNALNSSAALVRFIREHRIEEVFSCWSGDEAIPAELERTVPPEALLADDFVFRERELLRVDLGTDPARSHG